MQHRSSSANRVGRLCVVQSGEEKSAGVAPPSEFSGAETWGELVRLTAPTADARAANSGAAPPSGACVVVSLREREACALSQSAIAASERCKLLWPA